MEIGKLISILKIFLFLNRKRMKRLKHTILEAKYRMIEDVGDSRRFAPQY